jgi:hypothetical protein
MELLRSTGKTTISPVLQLDILLRCFLIPRNAPTSTTMTMTIAKKMMPEVLAEIGTGGGAGVGSGVGVRTALFFACMAVAVGVVEDAARTKPGVHRIPARERTATKTRIMRKYGRWMGRGSMSPHSITETLCPANLMKNTPSKRGVFWRRGRDSNPRTFVGYTLSKRAR